MKIFFEFLKEHTMKIFKKMKLLTEKWQSIIFVKKNLGTNIMKI